MRQPSLQWSKGSRCTRFLQRCPKIFISSRGGFVEHLSRTQAAKQSGTKIITTIWSHPGLQHRHLRVIDICGQRKPGTVEAQTSIVL
jgi:hypothetical protein